MLIELLSYKSATQRKLDSSNEDGLKNRTSHFVNRTCNYDRFIIVFGSIDRRIAIVFY